MKYVRLAFICYIGVFVLLLLWKQGNPAWNLSLYNANGISINLYTILFIVFFGVGYGAYYSTADMPIPMVADCSDYETYRSGKYIPGIMGTLFSLVDKLVSSLSATVVGIAVSHNLFGSGFILLSHGDRCSGSTAGACQHGKGIDQKQDRHK